MSIGKGRVHWGLAVPQAFTEGPVDMPLVRRCVVRAEELGYDSLWVTEPALGRAPSLEPITLLCYVAALTTRVRLGPAVLVPVFRNPTQLAKSLATLDVMSGGRLIVGVGLGGPPRNYQAFGVPPEGRVRRFEEGIRVMKALWTEPAASLQGEFWHLEGTRMEPKPMQKPHPPLWFGGHHPQALARAVRMGDGFMGAGSTSTGDFQKEVALLRSMLEQAGRDPATFPIGKRVYLAVDRDRARAERRLQQWFGHIYGNAATATKVSVFGSAEECIEGIGQVVAAGAQTVLLHPAFDLAEHIEVLAKDIVPRL
ncbi:MAG: LLM class flavin-dependent oxidoreductase [Chloroflexi bacterium]|nr:LLM class flavin-dependent oxidoreductase [Chloroflexota bacterium]